MINRQVSRQYLKFIEQSGFKATKDDMGYYYEKGYDRFSIIVIGSIYECYQNKNNEGQWNLLSKSSPFFDFSQALIWICSKIQNIQ